MAHCLTVVFMRIMQVQKLLIAFWPKFHRVQSSSAQYNDERMRSNEGKLKLNNKLDNSVSICRKSIFNLN